MAAISLQDLHKRYPNGHAAVTDVTLEIADGEMLALVGPSGCGKSTLLRLIAGLEAPDRGRILLGGTDVTSTPPQDRDLAMVFQSYALYPHMTVRENLAYGLRVRKTGRETIDARIAAVAGALDLAPLLDRRPAQLSGGQRQRVALGRAMVREPRAFLFDEPLSNLDPALRVQARTELARLQRRLNTTVVYVTHDQEEALTLGSRVAVMRNGRIEQVAAPMHLYAAPANTFVARFIGQPPMNLLTPPIPGIVAPPDAIVGIRPHDVVVGADGPIHADVDVVESRGHDAVVHMRARLPETPVIVAVVPAVRGALPREVAVTLPQSRIHLFARDSSNRMTLP